jgi:hypothetical protein
MNLKLEPRLSCSVAPFAAAFEGSHPVAHAYAEDAAGESPLLTLNILDAQWEADLRILPLEDGVYDIRLAFRLVRGRVEGGAVGFTLRFPEWSASHYVSMPAAAYNGNRFEARKLPYAPMLSDPADLRTDVPTLITDVPRLSIEDGPSRIQLLTRDLSTPAVGFYDPGQGKGFWLLTDQGTPWGDSGIEVEESGDRRHASITVTAPGVRHDTRYTICSTSAPSDDRGACYAEGDLVVMRARLHAFECPNVQRLFDRFMDIRQDLSGEALPRPLLPFSSAWAIQENKYNQQNWVESFGYYSVGMRENMHQDWQIGWVGGMMATFPLLFQGSDVSRSRARRSFDFLFGGGQDRSGFFHGCGHEGRWYGDNFHDPHLRWHLIRKSADALYFLLKQFMLMKRQDPTCRLPEHWEEGTRRCADAFVRLWDRYGQFGQFVDSETGEIIVGGSASAAIAPAGLALAAVFFGQPEYGRVARASAEDYYVRFVRQGYTTGGPGEILQNPDSESAFGLLESFVVLYETTGAGRWIAMASDQANQCATWCVSYDFAFPPESTFGKLDMRTAGSVYANVQNKHSSPGICTLSGDSLFKLYRATGKTAYLELIREIAHGIPQYLSRADRPIPGLRRMPGGGPDDTELVPMPAGWMNERVEMSDWWEPTGEIFYGSCWCEVSAMLTYIEVPGLYVQPDTGLVCAIDHVTVEGIRRSGGEDGLIADIRNPTPFEAVVKVLSEPSVRLSVPLGQNALWGCPEIRLLPGELRRFFFPDEGGTVLDDGLV